MALGGVLLVTSSALQIFDGRHEVEDQAFVDAVSWFADEGDDQGEE